MIALEVDLEKEKKLKKTRYICRKMYSTLIGEMRSDHGALCKRMHKIIIIEYLPQCQWLIFASHFWVTPWQKIYTFFIQIAFTEYAKFQSRCIMLREKSFITWKIFNAFQKIAQLSKLQLILWDKERGVSSKHKLNYCYLMNYIECQGFRRYISNSANSFLTYNFPNNESNLCHLTFTLHNRLIVSFFRKMSKN